MCECVCVCACRHRPEESSDPHNPFPRDEDTEPRRRATCPEPHRPREAELFLPRNCPANSPREGLPGRPPQPQGYGRECRAQGRPSAPCWPHLPQAREPQSLSILAPRAQTRWPGRLAGGEVICARNFPGLLLGTGTSAWGCPHPRVCQIPGTGVCRCRNEGGGPWRLKGAECVNRCVCGVSVSRVATFACSLVCSAMASGRLRNSARAQDPPQAAASGCPGPCFTMRPSGNLARRHPLVGSGPQAAKQEPNLPQCSLVTPALAVEARDPAITSTWVRPLLLPGRVPSATPAHTCRGPTGLLGHLRGLSEDPG